MKNFFLSEKGIFLSALVLSASIHGFLLGASGWISSDPQVSVIQAPSSLEINLISQPVVTVIEKEIVSEEIIEEVSEEIVFNHQIEKSVSEKNLPSSSASQESRGAITKAEPLIHMNPAPPYPRIARQRGWEGIVRLKVFVGKDGIAQKVDIAKSSGYGILDKAALRTVENWEFLPARAGSMRFSSKITIPIQFTLIKK